MSISPRDLAVAAATIYSRRLRAFIARRVDNPQDIEDVAQSTIVKILKIANDTPFIVEPFGFLCKTVRRVLAERLIKAARDRIQIEWSEDVEHSIALDMVANSEWCRSKNPKEHEHYADIFESIDMELDTMSPKLSIQLLMSLEGYKYAEIAELLDTTVDAVKKNLQRVRGELKKRTSPGQDDGQR